MISDHIASQLLTSGIAMADKVQRNTQAELLAVLTTILTWREELTGSCLLILGDSTSSETNLRNCTATSTLVTSWLKSICSALSTEFGSGMTGSRQNKTQVTPTAGH